MTTDETVSDYFDERQLAARLNMSAKWLQKMRRQGGGIPFSKFGSNVRYKINDIEAFEALAVRLSTSESTG